MLLFPSPENQERVIRALGTALPASMYHPGYSMVAYPWSTRYQNSNQWLLEVLAENGLQSSDAVRDALLRALSRHTAGCRQADDVTLISAVVR